MSIFKQIENGFENIWNGIQHLFVDDVEPYVKSALSVIEQNGGSFLLHLAEDGLTALTSGSTFGVVAETIVAALKSNGIKIVEDAVMDAAKTALQFAIVKAGGQAAVTAGTVPDKAPNAPAAATSESAESSADAQAGASEAGNAKNAPDGEKLPADGDAAVTAA